MFCIILLEFEIETSWSYSSGFLIAGFYHLVKHSTNYQPMKEIFFQYTIKSHTNVVKMNNNNQIILYLNLSYIFVMKDLTFKKNKETEKNIWGFPYRKIH